MNIGPTNTVAELALDNPGSLRILEKFGIDYCCGGGRLLDDACRDAGVEFEKLIGMIDETRSDDGDVDWRNSSLGVLMDHILDTHHVFTRNELSRINGLLARVCDRHGANHPELNELRVQFELLSGDLIPHMLKEEQVLFPYLRQLEEAVVSGARPPEPFFMTVRNPVRMMEREHESAGSLLRQLRALSGDYAPPADACMSFRALYSALEELEADLHRHIHLENNVLFPRAVEMEASVSQPAGERRNSGHPGGCFGG